MRPIGAGFFGKPVKNVITPALGGIGLAKIFTAQNPQTGHNVITGAIGTAGYMMEHGADTNAAYNMDQTVNSAEIGLFAALPELFGAAVASFFGNKLGI